MLCGGPCTPFLTLVQSVMISGASHLTVAQIGGPQTMTMTQTSQFSYSWRAKKSFCIVKWLEKI